MYACRAVPSLLFDILGVGSIVQPLLGRGGSFRDHTCTLRCGEETALINQGAALPSK